MHGVGQRIATIWATVPLLVLGACGGPPDLGPPPQDYARIATAAEGRYDEDVLTAALGRIGAWLEAHAPRSAAVLQPGLTDAQLDAAVERAGLRHRLPEEVRALYRWRNGAKPGTDVPFVAYHRFLSFEKALSIATGSELKRWFGLPPGSLPILAFQEEYYYVRCEMRERKGVPVLWRLLESPESAIRHTNLTAMFQTWADAQAEGAVVLDADTGMQAEHPDRWPAIHARHNPELHR